MKRSNNYVTLRPIYRWIGVVIVLFALLLLVFENIMEPTIIKYLSMSEVGRHLVGFVPYVPILLIAVGAYFSFMSRDKPLRPSKDQVEDGKF